MPEGRNVYVLRTYNNPTDGGDVEIWSPVTADCFYFKLHNDNETFCGVTVRKASHMEVRLNDPVCTMKHIWCVVGQQNIWANIQKFDFPVLMSFDFNNRNHWKPLFDDENHKRKYYPLDIHSI